MKNEMRKIIFGLIILSMLGSCAPKKAIGDIYLLVSPAKGDIEKHTLLRVSSDCFIQEIECSTPETVLAFPKDYSPPYVFAPMFWSPNGKYLFSISEIFNYSQSTYELLSYDVEKDKVEKLISGQEYINDFAWNPNSKWAAITLANRNDKDVQILLISPEGEKKILSIKADNADGNISPLNPNQLEWINENEFLFAREQVKNQSATPSMRLFKFNINTGIETKIQLPSMETFFVLSPGGNFAFFLFPVDNVVNTYDFKTQKTIELKGFQSKQPLSWSPDGKWILACSNDNATYVVSPDMRNIKKIIDGCTVYYNWMPDNDHIIFLFYSYIGNSIEVDKSHWYIASISANTIKEITIPGLDLKKNKIDGIYVQPIKP